MTPGFQRKLNRLIDRMSGLDPHTQIKLELPKGESTRNQSCTLSVSHTVNQQPVTTAYTLEADGEGCNLYLPNQHTPFLHLDNFNCVDAPEELLTDLASRQFMTQLKDRLPDLLASQQATLSGLDPQGHFSILKDGEEHTYTLNVTLRSYVNYVATLMSDLELWDIEIPIHDLYAGPLLQQILDDPDLHPVRTDRHQAILQYLHATFQKSGVGADLDGSIHIALDGSSYIDVDFKDADMERFTLDMNTPSTLLTGTAPFSTLAKVTRILDGLSPTKVLEAITLNRQDKLTPEPEPDSMESSVELV